MSFIDSKYVGIISTRLQKFSKKKEGLYNFRCPYCGDSQKSKNKTRGYLYKRKSDLNFKCHNCGVTRSFTYFLKDLDQNIYKEYVLERYKEGLTGKGTTAPDPVFQSNKPIFQKSKQSKYFENTQKISDLNNTHPARQYLSNRKIPEKYFSKFYFVEDYNVWAKTNNSKKESRIIIPLLKKDGQLFGYQARSLDPTAKLRYITTILDSEYPKVFGLDSVKDDETVYVTEGPFDSLFIRNGIAMCGSDVSIDSFAFDDVVYVFDNEPRNREICDRMSKVIDMGYKIVIWPSSIKEKDINDMILSNNSPQGIIDKNTFQGIQAKIKFTEWKKV